MVTERYPRCVRRIVAASMVVLAASIAWSTAATAQEEPPPDSTPVDLEGDVTGGGVSDEPPPVLPLIPVPTGCSAPAMPHIVFVGKVVKRDYRTIRFEIEQIRSGRSDPFALDDRIDVRFGLDAQYLDDGESYLVSAVVDPDLGLLVSRVSDPIENFGGDEVIGVSETDVDCPIYEDPMRTLHLDGTPIDASVIKPFLDAKVRISAALLLPFGLAFGAIFVLAMFRLSLSGLYHGVVDTRGGAGSVSGSQLSGLVEGLGPSVDLDLLGRAVGPASHEHRPGDGTTEDQFEHDAVGRELAAVPADAIGPLIVVGPLVGLVVDDDAALVRLDEEVDVPLDRSSADVGGDEQLAVVAGVDRPLHDGRLQCRAGEQRDGGIHADDAFGRALGRRLGVDAVARPEVGVLEDRVHGAPDCGAVPTALPRRQVEVDGALVEAGVGVGLAGQERRAHTRATPGGGERPPSFVCPLVDVGPGELGHLGRGTTKRPRAGSSAASAVFGSAAPDRWSSAPLTELALISRLAGIAVQRDDEVVDGAGAGDIEQTAAFGVAHLLVDRLEVLEDRIGALRVRDRPGIGVPHDRVARRRASAWSSCPTPR